MRVCTQSDMKWKDNMKELSFRVFHLQNFVSIYWKEYCEA
jgi:hypothetical protein